MWSLAGVPRGAGRLLRTDPSPERAGGPALQDTTRVRRESFSGDVSKKRHHIPREVGSFWKLHVVKRASGHHLPPLVTAAGPGPAPRPATHSRPPTGTPC